MNATQIVRIVVFTSLLFVGVLLSSHNSFAAAQEACLRREVALSQLSEKFEERIVGRGLTNNGQVMIEILTNDNGSWTIVATDVRGQTCRGVKRDSAHRASGKERLKLYEKYADIIIHYPKSFHFNAIATLIENTLLKK